MPAEFKTGYEYLKSCSDWDGCGEFSLGPMQAVMQHLGNPQDKLLFVHVAGTNGKGSVAAAIASILGAAGFRVGLTTSPHLIGLSERIMIDGVEASEELIGSAALEVSRAAQACLVKLTFFEAITATAFLAFYRAGVDWIVAEVGLGGRLDATNVVARPKACVITSIGEDHLQILGGNLAAVTAEKAGIIKTGATVCTGNLSTESSYVVDFICKQLGANRVKLEKSGSCYSISREQSKLSTRVTLESQDGLEELEFVPSLQGTHQEHNMALAVAVGRQLGVHSEACKFGVEHLHWPARLEFIEHKGIKFCLDAAHNVPGIYTVTDYLQSNGLEGLICGFGAVQDKNWQAMIEVLSPLIVNWGVMAPETSRAVPTQEIAAFLQESGRNVLGYGDDYQSFIDWCVKAKPTLPVLCCGSIYMIGKLRGLLKGPMRAPVWQRRQFKSAKNSNVSMYLDI